MPKQKPNMNNKLLDVVARSCQNRCPLPLAPPHSHTTQTFAKQPVIGKGNYFEFPPLILYLGLQIQNLEAQRQFKKGTKKSRKQAIQVPTTHSQETSEVRRGTCLETSKKQTNIKV